MICPIMDARRSQVYTGLYYAEEELQTEKEPCAMDMHELISELNARGERTVFLGDGVPVYESLIRRELTVAYSFAPPQSSRQRAASVAALGELYMKQGRMVTAADFKPEYLRKPQAEREREGIEL